jgi:hypothetical protein
MVHGAVIIGYGTIGRMHHAVLPKSVPVVAVIDPRANNLSGLDEKIARFSDLESFFENPPPDDNILFYDVCPPTAEHLMVINKVLENRPEAKILVEKPVCMPNQVDEMLEISRNNPFIAAAENYSSSTLDQQVVHILKRLNIEDHPLEIEVEFSKTRVEDVEKGRFLAPSVIGYELTHMLTIIQNIRKIKRIENPKLNYITDMVLPSGKLVGLQGSCGISFSTEKGDNVFLYSSMDGMIGLPISEFLIDFPTGRPIINYGDSYKYRVLRITDPLSGYQIIGQYEPIRDIQGFERIAPIGCTSGRLMARIIVLKDGVQVNRQQFVDDTLRTHIGRVLDYFVSGGHAHNYMPEAIETVKFLGECEKQVNILSDKSEAKSMEIEISRDSDIGTEEILMELCSFLFSRTGIKYRYDANDLLDLYTVQEARASETGNGLHYRVKVKKHDTNENRTLEILLDSASTKNQDLATALLQQFAVRLNPRGTYNDDSRLKTFLCQDTLGVSERDLYGRIGLIINDIDEDILSFRKIRKSKKEFYSLALDYVRQFSQDNLVNTANYILKILSLYKLSQFWVDFESKHAGDFSALSDDQLFIKYRMQRSPMATALESIPVTSIFALLKDAAKNSFSSFDEQSESLRKRKWENAVYLDLFSKFEKEHQRYKFPDYFKLDLASSLGIRYSKSVPREEQAENIIKGVNRKLAKLFGGWYIPETDFGILQFGGFDLKSLFGKRTIAAYTMVEIEKKLAKARLPLSAIRLLDDKLGVDNGLHRHYYYFEPFDNYSEQDANKEHMGMDSHDPGIGYTPPESRLYRFMFTKRLTSLRN